MAPDKLFKSIMGTVVPWNPGETEFHQAVQAAEAYGVPGNLADGANIIGFLKVAYAIMAQGLVKG